MDRTDLVPVTASIFWLCKSDPDSEKHYLEPGTCRDGSPREKAFDVRPHGDHNPRHGGPSVFMSEDLFHHVEATLVAPTKTRPATLPRVLLRRIHAADKGDRRVGARGAGGQERHSRPGALSPLVLSRIRDGNAMEVRLPNATAPSESAPAFFTLRVKFKPSDKDWVTDHTFTSYSKESGPIVRSARLATEHCRTPASESSGRGPSATVLDTAARRQTGSARRTAERAWIRSQSSGKKAVSAASGIRRFVPRTSR